MNGLRRAFGHGFGLACVIGAVTACATGASPPRGAADEPVFVTVASNSPHSSATGDGALPTALEAPATPPTKRESRRSRDELPWLSPSHIGAAVRAHHSDFQACQALGDLESQREDGTVTVGWAVYANGSVKGVTLGSSTFASEGVNACVLDVAKQVTFPASAAPTQVSWTVKFRGAPHAALAGETRSPRRVSPNLEESPNANCPIGTPRRRRVMTQSTCPSPAKRGHGEPGTNLGHEVLADATPR